MNKVICRFTGPAENNEVIEKIGWGRGCKRNYSNYVSWILLWVLKLFKFSVTNEDIIAVWREIPTIKETFIAECSGNPGIHLNQKN